MASETPLIVRCAPSGSPLETPPVWPKPLVARQSCWPWHAVLLRIPFARTGGFGYHEGVSRGA